MGCTRAQRTRKFTCDGFCLIVMLNLNFVLLNCFSCLMILVRLTEIEKRWVKRYGHNWNNSATDSGKKEEGSNPPVEFTGPQVVENDCKIWTIICVRTLIPKNSFIKPFLCGFCVIKELTKSLLWCGWPVFCNKGWQHYQMRAQEKCAYLWCWWEARCGCIRKKGECSCEGKCRNHFNCCL